MLARYLVGLTCAWATLSALAVTLAETNASQDGGQDQGPIPMITVTGDKRQVPIAIPTFKRLGSEPDNRDVGAPLSGILRNDLSQTGFLKVLDPKSYLV